MTQLDTQSIPDETPDIKRRPNGSIDTAHYLAIGASMRSEQAHKMIKAVVPRNLSKAAPQKRVFSWRFWFVEAIGTS